MLSLLAISKPMTLKALPGIEFVDPLGPSSTLLPFSSSTSSWDSLQPLTWTTLASLPSPPQLARTALRNESEAAAAPASWILILSGNSTR